MKTCIPKRIRTIHRKTLAMKFFYSTAYKKKDFIGVTSLQILQKLSGKLFSESTYRKLLLKSFQNTE